MDIKIIKNVFKEEYEILDILGKGGMATVYKAVHKNLNRIVALKIIPKEYSENIEFRNRFEREAIDSARLSHPNIITIYDHGEKEGFQYISMAHLPSGSLYDVIKERGALPETEAKNILIQILNGVAFAHSCGIIHRDIKSSNIMFDANKNPILMDFGISKSKDSINLTISGSFIGTLEYASPEQIESSDIVDSRSDIYSLGILAYEMVTGTVPFKGSMTSVINHVINTPPPQIQQINADISNEFSNIINKAIQKKPQDRYQNVSEFINSLENISYNSESKLHKLKENTQIKSAKKRKEAKPKKSKSLKNNNKIILLAFLAILLIVLITTTILRTSYNTDNINLKNPSVAAKHNISTQLSFEDIERIYGIKLVKVQGGKYLMGSNIGEYDEKPIHPVNVNTFYISSTEITQNSWKKVIPTVSKDNMLCDNCPIVNISWNDATSFINKLNGLSGLIFSLPYESEWEYAAKEGKYGINVNHVPVYSGSVDPKIVGWFNENSNNVAHHVATLSPNKLNLFDMSGNVWEWCYDNYDKEYYNSPNPNYSGPQYGNNKVIRGGCFSESKIQMRNSNREKANPGLRKNNIGFRIVLR